MDAHNPKDIVRRGYDAVSLRYDQVYGAETTYQRLLGDLRRRTPAGGTVLDLGCGSGVPVARTLTDAGHQVTGIDISGVQICRARELVPQAEFIHVDATAATFDLASFDAVVSFYALIHVPLAEQPSLLRKIAEWLRPGGWFVATTGHRAWTGVEEDWLGGGAPMWWSHADAATNRKWIAQAGLPLSGRSSYRKGAGAMPCSLPACRSVPRDRHTADHRAADRPALTGQLPAGGHSAETQGREQPQLSRSTT